MGAFTHPITFIGPAGETTIQVLVNPDVPYAQVPRPILETIRIQPTRRWPFILADGREAEYDVADVWMRIDGREWPSPCIFRESDTQPVIGFVTLEVFGLAIDPTGQKLIRVPGKLVTPRLLEEK